MSRKAYKTDITDEQWNVIKDMLPVAKSDSAQGRKRTTDLREVINAIFYLQKNGCVWEMLPHDFPPSVTVYMYFSRWERKGLIEKIREKLREQSSNNAEKENQ